MREGGSSGARQDSAGFERYLTALEARHQAVGKEIYLALDNGSCHRSRVSQAALAAHAEWLHVIWLARYSPELNPKEREWKQLKRDARSHLAPTLRVFVDEILAGLRALEGTRVDSVDEVPAWWVAGHRREPTGRPPGWQKGANASCERAPAKTRAVDDVPAAA